MTPAQRVLDMAQATRNGIACRVRDHRPDSAALPYPAGIHRVLDQLALHDDPGDARMQVGHPTDRTVSG